MLLLQRRYRVVERLAAEEFERERSRVPARGRTEITLCLSSSPASRSVSRCIASSPAVAQEGPAAAAAHEASGEHSQEETKKAAGKGAKER